MYLQAYIQIKISTSIYLAFIIKLPRDIYRSILSAFIIDRNLFLLVKEVKWGMNFSNSANNFSLMMEKL